MRAKTPAKPRWLDAFEGINQEQKRLEQTMRPKRKQSPASVGNAAEARKATRRRGYHKPTDLLALSKDDRNRILEEEAAKVAAMYRKKWEAKQRRSPAAVGAAAEKRVAAKCEVYRLRGIADIRRFPTETRTIYKDGKSIVVRTAEGQWCDFVGYWGLDCPYPGVPSRHIHIEVKASKTFHLAIEDMPHYYARIQLKGGNFSGLSWPQLQELRAADAAGGTALLVWVVGDRMAVFHDMLRGKGAFSTREFAWDGSEALKQADFEAYEVRGDDFLRVEAGK